jgi:hypothetical protein
MKSRAHRRTLAALVWSEATAKWLRDAKPVQPEIIEACKAIFEHCQSAYLAIEQHNRKCLDASDIKRFLKASEAGGVNQHFPGQQVDIQKMVAFCAFLLEEPVTCIKSNPRLQAACQSVADCMAYLAGYIEDDLGYPVFESAVEAESAYKSWREVGW